MNLAITSWCSKHDNSLTSDNIIFICYQQFYIFHMILCVEKQIETFQLCCGYTRNIRKLVLRVGIFEQYGLLGMDFSIIAITDDKVL